MSSKRKTLTLLVIFYITMVIFTVSARKLHNASLPRVTTQNLRYEEFKMEVDTESEAVDQQDNNKLVTYYTNLAIPKELYDNQKIYIVSKEILNGEERDFAKEIANLEIGRSNDISYEVLRGLTILDQVIISGQESIQDGSEVYVED